jgi:hypothetical protein
MGWDHETYQGREVKGLHDFSDGVDALVRINPDSTDDRLNKSGSKLGRSLHRVLRVNNHTTDRATFASDSCTIVVGQ